jgi:ribosomal 50S subunit-recycling heat shock protein
MRLDKFLKVSRLVKRRTVANALCDSGKVYINDKAAKAGTEVKPNDVLSIRTTTRAVTVRIVDVPTRAVPAQDADKLYTVLESVSKGGVENPDEALD